MRTKTLLLSAAALAAGLVTTLAQSNVYSVNIVGYVNVPTPNGITFQNNSLDASGGSTAAQVIPNTGTWDGSEIQVWTGVNYKIAVFDSLTDDTTTGFTDRNGNPVPAPPLTNNLGYFLNNLSGSSNNITYVGSVRGVNGINITNIFNLRSSPALNGVASAVPIAGGIQSVLQLVNVGGALDGCEIQKPIKNGAGAIIGFSIAVYDSLTDDTTTGFTDRNGNPVAEPSIKVGEGFFFNNLSGSPKTWTQILNVGP